MNNPIENINWPLLKIQKNKLLEVLDKPDITNEQSMALTGILHLIDSIQDYGVDVLKVDENIVFNLSKD